MISTYYAVYTTNNNKFKHLRIFSVSTLILYMHTYRDQHTQKTKPQTIRNMLLIHYN